VALLTVHLSEMLTTTIFKNESYILLYSLKNMILTIKDNELNFICILNNFINRKGVVVVVQGGLSRFGVR
jgi:hypothetical protein